MEYLEDGKHRLEMEDKDYDEDRNADITPQTSIAARCKEMGTYCSHISHREVFFVSEAKRKSHKTRDSHALASLLL